MSKHYLILTFTDEEHALLHEYARQQNKSHDEVIELVKTEWLNRLTNKSDLKAEIIPFEGLKNDC
jgi:hypothetical protein